MGGAAAWRDGEAREAKLSGGPRRDPPRPFFCRIVDHFLLRKGVSKLKLGIGPAALVVVWLSPRPMAIRPCVLSPLTLCWKVRKPTGFWLALGPGRLIGETAV